MVFNILFLNNWSKRFLVVGSCNKIIMTDSNLEASLFTYIV